jgi:hypothetical protein
MSHDDTSAGTTPAEIEADIARQREELATTVTQLQAKLDVKARARHKAHDLRDRTMTATGRPRPDLVVAVIVGAFLVGGLLLWRRRR